MDGVAVRVADAGRSVEVRGDAFAGHAAPFAVTPGTAIDIATGAPCPPGTEAVVKAEDILREAGRVVLPERIASGQHLQPAGELRRAGETVAPAGTRLGPLVLAAAVGAGCRQARVRARPSLAVITTGDELRGPDAALDQGLIPDSNGPMLSAMARALGLPPPRQLHATDDTAALARAIDEARDTDMLVLSGGVSVGKRDLVPRALESLGARTVLHGVRQQPGKPLLVAVRASQLIFGLPGTPLGSHLGFHRYVTAAIRKWLGAPSAPARLRGRLGRALRARGQRTLFRLVRAERGEGGWLIDPLEWRGSSDLAGPALANGYCRFEPGEHDVAAGAMLDWEPLAVQDDGS
jgi:molybdopterin molybdotransferase